MSNTLLIEFYVAGIPEKVYGQMDADKFEDGETFERVVHSSMTLLKELIVKHGGPPK